MKSIQHWAYINTKVSTNSNLQLFIKQTYHVIRITRIRYGFWRFLSDTAVLSFDTDFNKIYGELIFTHILPCMSD